MGYGGDRLKEAETASRKASGSAHKLRTEATALVDAARRNLDQARSSGGDKAGVRVAKATLKDAKKVRKRADRMATSAVSANPRNRVPVR